MAATRKLVLIEPVRLRAEVVHGFGRGSKQLGFPTANVKIAWEVEDPSLLSDEERAVLQFAQSHEAGVYCAFGCVESDPERRVHKVAMSMGWNPTFSDVKAKTIEPWLMHEFGEDFYGSHLRLLVLGYVRPELKFASVDELIAEISMDGEFCREALDDARLAPFRSDMWLAEVARTSSPGPPLGSTGPKPLAFPEGIFVGCGLRGVLRRLPLLGPRCARLLLARHGEAVANEQGRLCGGGLDSELSARGIQQARRLAEELSGEDAPPLTLVASSSLRRASASADTVALRVPGASRAIAEDLCEMRYGSFEGVLIAEVSKVMADTAELWRKGQTQRRLGDDLGAESPEELLERALEALTRILSGRAGQTVLLVCHSFLNKALMASAIPGLGLRHLLDVPQRNCAVNIMDFRCEHAGLQSTPLSRFEVFGVDLVAQGAGGKL